MCENLHYKSVYFKELHNEQKYYWPTIYRAGAAVVSTITSNNYLWSKIEDYKVASLSFTRNNNINANESVQRKREADEAAVSIADARGIVQEKKSRLTRKVR